MWWSVDYSTCYRGFMLSGYLFLPIYIFYFVKYQIENTWNLASCSSFFLYFPFAKRPVPSHVLMCSYLLIRCVGLYKNVCIMQLWFCIALDVRVISRKRHAFAIKLCSLPKAFVLALKPLLALKGAWFNCIYVC